MERKCILGEKKEASEELLAEMCVWCSRT